MKDRRRRKANQKLAFAVQILLLAFFVVQSIQVVHAQNMTTNGQWALNFGIENGQDSATTTFSPFDQIQLFATVTYGNATQPDILVYFNVTGPSNSANPTSITRIETTNSSGEAGFSFRLPIENENESSIVGTWQSFAAIQTTNGTLQQSLSFTTQWNMEIASINLENSQSQDQTVFSQGDDIIIQLTINNAGQPQTANITLDMQDQQGNIINQTQILNSQITTSSTNGTQLQTDLRIPNDATAGQMTINTAVYSGTYQNVNLPVAENQIAYFTIATNTSTTATPAPTTTPPTTTTPASSPNSPESSVTLFSWLLIATGLFTFTLLLFFLKRKPTPKLDSQTPNLPSPTPSPATATSPVISATTEKMVLQERPIAIDTTATKLTLETATEETVQSTMTQASPSQMLQSAAMLTKLSRISNSANRIKALKTVLKSEQDQLAKDLDELGKIVDEEQKMINQELENVKKEAKKLKQLTQEDNLQTTTTTPTPKIATEKTMQATMTQASPSQILQSAAEALSTTDLDKADKSDLGAALTQKRSAEAMQAQISRISNSANRIKALKTVLKSEQDQLAKDLDELGKIVDEEQKMINQELENVKKEAKKLKQLTQEDN